MKVAKVSRLFSRIISTLCAALFAVCLLPQGAQAANVNWVGNTAGANWGDAANWSAAIANQTAVFNASGTAGTTLNNNIVGLTLAGITYSATASGYIINGNSITLGGNIANTAGGATGQTNNLAMVLSGNRTVATVPNTSITLGGNISAATLVMGAVPSVCSRRRAPVT